MCFVITKILPDTLIIEPKQLHFPWKKHKERIIVFRLVDAVFSFWYLFPELNLEDHFKKKIDILHSPVVEVKSVQLELDLCQCTEEGEKQRGYQELLERSLTNP